MAIDFELADLTGDFDDVQLATVGSYQVQTDPAPPDAGNYRMRIDEVGRVKTQGGEPIDDEGYPQYEVKKLTILEPESHAGVTLYPYQKYSLKPRKSGKRPGSIPIVDLLMGFDDHATFMTGREAVEQLQGLIESGSSYVGVADWIGKDSEFMKATFDENGGSLDSWTAEEKNEFFNKAIIRGQKKFPKVNGKYVPEFKGPSGEMVKARASLGRIYPSSKSVSKMGPFTQK